MTVRGCSPSTNALGQRSSNNNNSSTTHHHWAPVVPSMHDGRGAAAAGDELLTQSVIETEGKGG